jgi:Rieske Fe-S protein
MGDVGRRAALAGICAGAGLVASYGLLAAYALAFLFPPPARRAGGRLFVGRREDFRAGAARPVVDQRGRNLLVLARDGGLAAFDTRCPHLGCRVHWEPDKERFFCPCHQGVFAPDGTGIAGPPAAAGQRLARAALEIDQASGTVFLTS